MNFQMGSESPDSFYFPMGEYNYRSNGENRITLQFPCGDLFHLSLIVDAMRGRGTKDIELICPYLPYARQDRRAVQGESHSLKVFCEYINSLEFSKVVVYDPHSDVVEALLENACIYRQWNLAKNAVERVNPTCIVSPDAGSLKKAEKLANRFGLPVLQCGKNRDPQNGKLSGFWAHHEGQDLERVLVVDDICDAGGTFLGLAERLTSLGARSLHLYVTHGGFTHLNGVRHLMQAYSSVHTTNSLPQENVNNLFVKDIWKEWN